MVRTFGPLGGTATRLAGVVGALGASAADRRLIAS
jgi:hypothetical protein